ncbi:protein Wnt-8b [Protopterus annectens]|uniref:protein Wnt-8b n=1 Tax=Protopterus annectens TaxID=7888 RepID=UPI001CFAD665|nr:protein Wnt-8b [Protopterus annectens]
MLLRTNTQQNRCGPARISDSRRFTYYGVPYPPKADLRHELLDPNKAGPDFCLKRLILSLDGEGCPLIIDPEIESPRAEGTAEFGKVHIKGSSSKIEDAAFPEISTNFDQDIEESTSGLIALGPGHILAYLIYSSSVAAGAQSGIEECKHQFAWDRWNCPERALQLSTHSGLRSANQETAFVHAISSAGVMYTLTRNCSLGDFDNCGCDDSRNGQLGGQGWLWGGCSDNVGFGEAISKQFVDALETGQDARAAMNLHNNEAGRKAVKATMKRTCKCHGVSGSCTTQTCWLQLPDFREVGNYLKEKYHRALKVDLLKGAGNSAASRGAITETFSSISKKELVHLEDSPDYCLENKTLGLQGTQGRECLKRGKNLSKWEKGSCRRLCGECGLAVEERKAEMVSSCNCKFHWCCAVKCEQCRKSVTKYFCVKREKQPKADSNTHKKNLKLRKRL